MREIEETGKLERIGVKIIISGLSSLSDKRNYIVATKMGRSPLRIEKT